MGSSIQVGNFPEFGVECKIIVRSSKGRGPLVHLEPFSEADFDRLIAWIPTAEFLLQWAGPLFTFPLNRPQLEKYLEDCRESPPVRLAFRGVNAETGAVVGHPCPGPGERRVGRRLI